MLKDKLNISTIDIDLYRNHIYNKEKIKSLDVNSRFKRFRFFYNGLLLNLENITVRAYMIKQDNKEIFNDLTIIDGNIAELEFTNQTLLVPGILKLELVLYEGNAELSSFLIEYEVIKSIRSDNSIESSNEYTSLQIALQKIELWNTNYQQLYDKWNTDFNSLHANKSAILDNLKTTKENELNKLKKDKENELTTLYNSKDEELSNLKSTWDEEFRQKYDGLNEEYSGRVFDLEEDVLDASYSEDLLNENVTSFKVGTGTVGVIKKDYTEQMEQSIITLDNIVGKTRPRLEDSQLPSIRLTEIGIPVSSDESVYKFELPTDASFYKQGSFPAWDGPWETPQDPPLTNRIRVITPLKIPTGARYMYVRNRNLMYYFSVIGCRKDVTDSTTSDRTRDDLGWMKEDMYTGKIIEIPADWNSIGFSVRKKDDSAMITPSGDAQHLRGSIYFFKDISRISKEDLFLCSLPGGKIYDELKDGVLRKRVTRFNTSDGNWKTIDFSTVTGKDGVQYGRLTIQVPNIFVSSLEHIDCGNVEVIDYAQNKAEWDTPTRNTLVINTSSTKTRIAFTLSSRITQARAEEAILKDNPRMIVAQMQNAEAIDINASIKVNKEDLLFICSPIELDCTHKVQLNTKGQVEELQEVVHREKKSVWQKVKELTDIQMSLDVSGYIKFPSVFGGLMIQWGGVTLAQSDIGGEGVHMNYPIAFTNDCFKIVGNISAQDAKTNVKAAAGYVEKSTYARFKYRTVKLGLPGESEIAKVTISWIAIGR